MEFTDSSLEFTINVQRFLDKSEKAITDFLVSTDSEEDKDVFAAAVEDIWANCPTDCRAYLFYFAMAQWVAWAEVGIGKRSLDG